jgi:hypothetical protein
MPHPRVPPKKTQPNQTPFLLGPGRHKPSTAIKCFVNSSKYAAIPVEFDEALIETLPASAPPVDWTAEPPSPSTQIIGDR